MYQSLNRTDEADAVLEQLFRHLDLQGDDNPIAQLARFHWDRVVAIADGETQPPVAWEINPSGRCNLHCNFCLYPNAEKVFMDLDHYRRLVDEAVGRGAKAIIMAGDGEPLLHKQVEAMMEHVGDSGLDLFLFTNGTMIGRTVDPAVVAANATMVIWGLYAYDRATYEAVTRSKQFEQAQAALGQVIQARAAMGAGPALLGGWVGDGSNTDHAAPVARYGYEQGFDRMYMRSDVTGEGFATADAVELLYRSLSEARSSFDDPNFVQARMLFDRDLGFEVDEHGGAIALLHPGSTSWPANNRWLTWNDIMYVGPAGDVRVTNRNELASGSNAPFVIGSSKTRSLGTVLTTQRTSELVATGEEPAGQVVGRKAISNLVYNLVAQAGDEARSSLRQQVLDRYRETPLTQALRNYF